MERLTEAIHILPPESSGLASPLSVREYHVTFDGRHWNVGTGDGDAGPSSFDRDMALTLAIRTAEHDHADGMDVTVCVEDQDGTFRLAWASA
ncbi:MAG TPA: hypothetical protein VN718_04970 [Rhizomicrobium sp.]|nr:hypothetical protein [Rhizomicrobium sp.]